MVKNNTKDFGEHAVACLRDYLQCKNLKWSQLSGATVAPLLQEVFDTFTGQPELRFAADTPLPLAQPGATRRTRKDPTERNPLFDRLAILTGSKDLSELTKSERRTIGVALSEIKAATPDVTADEIERRVLCYKRNHRDWALTCGAMAKHWSEFSVSPETKNQKRDPYKTPQDWQTLFRSCFPDVEPPTEWSDLSIPLRTDILNKLP